MGRASALAVVMGRALLVESGAARCPSRPHAVARPGPSPGGAPRARCLSGTPAAPPINKTTAQHDALLGLGVAGGDVPPSLRQMSHFDEPLERATAPTSTPRSPRRSRRSGGPPRQRSSRAVRHQPGSAPDHRGCLQRASHPGSVGAVGHAGLPPRGRQRLVRGEITNPVPVAWDADGTVPRLVEAPADWIPRRTKWSWVRPRSATD